MNKISPYLLGLSLAAMCGLVAAAQQNPSGTASIPKVLQITREFSKPYKNGAAHEKTESAFIQSMNRAKWPTHYIGMTSLSGKSRSLFLTQYASFDAWEKDTAAAMKNKVLSAELERNGVADGEMLDAVDSEVFYLDEDLSYKSVADLSHRRFMEISVFHVRPGHRKDWTELVKMVKAGHDKAGTSAHWGAFELIYGGEGGTWAILTSDKSMADIDTGFQEDPKFVAAMGEDGMKKLGELIAAAVDTSHQELFAFNPNMSYVADEWIKADPAFWTPKPAAGPAMNASMEKKAKR